MGQRLKKTGLLTTSDKLAKFTGVRSNETYENGVHNYVGLYLIIIINDNDKHGGSR